MKYARRVQNIIWKEVAGKGILLDLRDGAYFEVDPLGLLIWKRCDGKVSLGETAQWMFHRFRVSPKRATEDIEDFVAQLERRKMVTLSEKPRG